MRVLIVEDDAALGVFLRKGLELQGHSVSLAGDGVSGLARVLDESPDLLLLDLGLPQRDGFAVLEAMKSRMKDTSVLVLTGRATVEERVRCLNLGADDVMLKPLSFSELTARCQALIRRRAQSIDPCLRFAGIELNRMARTVTRDGQTVDLTAKEFSLLEHLLTAKGRCCTRTELLREVWQMSPEAGTNVVDVYVNYLRKKLGAARFAASSGLGGIAVESASVDRIIDTVRGEGYALAAADTPARIRRSTVPVAPNVHSMPRGFGHEAHTSQVCASA